MGWAGSVGRGAGQVGDMTPTRPLRARLAAALVVLGLLVGACDTDPDVEFEGVDDEAIPPEPTERIDDPA